MRRTPLLFMGAVLCIIAVLAIVYTAGATAFIPQNNLSFKDTTAPQTGKIQATLVTPEGIQVTLLGVEHHGTQLLFHVNIHNPQSLAARIWNLDPDHGFALYDNATKSFVIKLDAISQADSATHPALAQTLAGQSSTSGWIAFALPASSQYANTLFYRYHTVHALNCGSAKGGQQPLPRSKCTPANLYSTISWDF